MKKVDLLIYESHLLTVNSSTIGLPGPEAEVRVELVRKKTDKSKIAKAQLRNHETGDLYGEIDITVGDVEFNQARENGSSVIWAAITVEQRLDDIIVDFIFGRARGNPKLEFFRNNILHTSYFTYAAKKVLVLNVVDELKLFGNPDQLDKKRKKEINKKKKELDGLLRNIMNYRNAFAHGKLEYEASKGCVLHYYSGGHRHYTLDNRFWSKVENENIRLHGILDSFIEAKRG